MSQYAIGQKVYFLGWFEVWQGAVTAVCENGYYWIDDEHYIRAERIAVSLDGIQRIVGEAVTQLQSSVATLPTIHNNIAPQA